MNELIPAWDWQTVVVAPWTTDLPIYGWIVLMGFFVCAACGLAGNYLILRRMALVGDAISHSVLPGLAIGFLVANAWSVGGGADDASASSHGFSYGLAVFIGSLVAGIVTTMLIEIIHKRTRIKQDAAIGITFSTLFALGVVLISVYADKVDLDADCVLHGEIAFVSIQPFTSLAGHEIAPDPVVRMGMVALLTLGLVLLFYKELLVSSFDPGLASSMGINATCVHYALMCWLSVIVISAFEAVGAILVIARSNGFVADHPVSQSHDVIHPACRVEYRCGRAPGHLVEQFHCWLHGGGWFGVIRIGLGIQSISGFAQTMVASPQNPSAGRSSNRT